MVKKPLEHQMVQMTHSVAICGLHGHLWVDGVLEPLAMVLGHEKVLAPPQMVVWWSLYHWSIAEDDVCVNGVLKSMEMGCIFYFWCQDTWNLDEALEDCGELEGICGNLDNLLEYDKP